MKRLFAFLPALIPGLAFGASINVASITDAGNIQAAIQAYKSAADSRIQTAQSDKNIPTTQIDAAKKQVTDNVTSAQSATPADVQAADTPSSTDATTSQSAGTVPATSRQSLNDRKLAELEDNAQAMRDKEQSDANKILGAATTAATAIGAQQMFENTARANAQETAENAMKAYLETFRCSYGNTGGIRGGTMNIELPGGNELFELYSEYVALANQLKKDKANLGLRAGIESQEIISSANTGLYDDVGTGIVSGAYTSIARALQNPEGEDAKAWAEAREKTEQKKKTGC